MIQERDLKILEAISGTETARFRSFLESHPGKKVEINGKTIPYLACGSGRRTLLTFAGGWGGVELSYDFVLGFEDRNRVIVVDVSAFDDPAEMSRGIDAVLDRESAGRVVVFGQSLSGIIGQSYFKRRYDRADGLVLTNTPAPRKERSKKWALIVLKGIPLGLIKALVRKKMTRLAEFPQPIPAEVQERRKFVAGLLERMLFVYWTKKNILNILTLAFAFNEKDAYAGDSFPGWKGKVLVVTSPDDPYHPDAELLMKNLPGAELVEFPSGFGHLAPQIHRDEFYGRIQRFIDGLDVLPA
ncbi:MAG: hypothetical protein A2Y56_02345 [Candidatus Aminicenantes bacterium RBG_13_63_10]|nr:MAG: hypothetical protein A2Y56_02345 [Candidatus Aminicenantes bacterium RBG_13_63_10]